MNLQNRISRLFDMAARLVPSVIFSRWHAKPPSQQQAPLPADATPDDRQLWEECRAMDASILPPSMVDEMYPVES